MRIPSNTFLQLHRADGHLDCTAYGRLLQYCSNGHLLRQGQQLHARLVLHSVIPDNFLASKLINFYAKLNCFPEARRVFDGIQRRNIFSWNALLMGYTVQGRFRDTLRLFSSLLTCESGDLKPDGITVSCALKALSTLSSRSRLARDIHGFVMCRGLDFDIFVMNGLITFYSRCNELSSARKLFDRMPKRDIVTWNSMIAGYSQSGYYEECKELYREMLGLIELKPDEVTAVSILQACGHSKDLLLGMEVHQLLVNNGVEMDMSLCNALVGFYAKCGSLDYAMELFKDMEEKDEFTYGSVISGYMDEGFVEEGMSIFRQIETPSLSTWNAVISGLTQNNHQEKILDLLCELLASGLEPNPVTLSSILPTCSHLSNLKGVKEIHAFAIKRSYHQNIYVATSIIDAYAKLGLLGRARQVFDRSKDRSLIIWTAIISAYSAHGDVHTALALFSEMLNNRIKPDDVTFTAVLAACAHTGMVAEAWKIYDSLSQNHDIEPTVEHCACMVDAMSRAKRLSEAADFIRKMPIEPSAKVWGALLNGASVSGDVDIGKFACDHLFKIEPENTGNYVIMANLYAQAGRWEEADMIREKMNCIGLKKTAGSSWVESKGALHSFISKDESGDVNEKICTLLGDMLGSTREE
ncbi:hypothetical protein SAY86_015391 [Trapa natans]|uniref:Pentatricopeptide repeat-containing protein n=1 Tax=Trapa natans TaxID=22666 RepID=A0AAN7QGW4_TRANT|nr:hypothetical protein SAY86_015391 [Trapa natans]